MSQQKTLYIFIDESGNFDFSNKQGASKHFMLTAFTTFNPALQRDRLLHFRYELLAQGKEYFHATQDEQIVRNKVFEFIASLKDQYEVYSVFARKNRTNPSLYKEINKTGKLDKKHQGIRLYQLLCKTLLGYIVKRRVRDMDNIVVLLASLYQNSEKNRAMIGEIKKSLKLQPYNIPFYIYCCPTQSDINLQLADYCCWALSARHEREENRPYEIIEKQVKSEFDIFRYGDIEYY